MADVAFILLEDLALDRSRIALRAADFGIAMNVSADENDQGIAVFDIEGGATLMVMPIDAAHPDVARMPLGPLSPNMDELTAAPAHAIVTALGLAGDSREIDTQMAALTAAVLAGCKPVGVMLGFGALFHKPALFADIAELGAKEQVLPMEICVDITGARESDTHMSFLTHNMPRYGREDFYVTAPIEGQGALGFLLDLARWMIVDPDKHLPTGDTVGRTADEKVRVERVPNPNGSSERVIWLDLP